MIELFGFISLLLTLYIYILVAAAVMSWLVAFNVVNPRNQFVSMVGEFLYRITEPVLRPIRNVLPNLGGIDISPIIVIIIIWFIQLVVLPILLRMLIT
jgi:YggT family protein